MVVDCYQDGVVLFLCPAKLNRSVDVGSLDLDWHTFHRPRASPTKDNLPRPRPLLPPLLPPLLLPPPLPR